MALSAGIFFASLKSAFVEGISAIRVDKECIDVQRCPQCKKVLFKKKDGRLECPNECEEDTKRTAFNTVIDPLKDRRANDTWNPWNNVHG